jgi:hypothetical protein
MTLEFAPALRDAINDVIESHVGTSPILELRTGAPPATLATGDSGTLVASLTLPSDWMSNSSAGVKALLGTWQDSAADAAGTVGHFRIKTSGAVAKMQGTVTATGGGGDLTLDNNVVTLGQQITITAFTLTAPNTDA